MEQPALLVVARIVDCPIWLFSDDNNAPIEIGDLMCGAPIELYWRATGIGHFIPNAVQETAADALARHVQRGIEAARKEEAECAFEFFLGHTGFIKEDPLNLTVLTTVQERQKTNSSGSTGTAPGALAQGASC